MGVDYYAYTLIGIQVDPKVFTDAHTITPTPIRGCSHKETKKKFCGECGEPTWKNSRSYCIFNEEPPCIDDDESYYDADEDFYELSSDGYRGFDVIIGTDKHSMAIGAGRICAGNYRSNSPHMTINLDDINNEYGGIEGLKQALKKILEPKGLWDDAKFGVHTILYCSY